MFRFRRFYDVLYQEKDLVTNIPSRIKLNKLMDTNFKDTEKDYLKLIEYFVKKYKVKKALEFGSSWGYFLYQLKLFNIESIGVEVSAKRREFGVRKLNVRIEKTLEDVLKEKEKFDIIFSIHTLEHLSDIKGIFKSFYNLLNERGMLFLEVPMLHSRNEAEHFERMGIVHPLGFSKEFFLKNLTREGFKTEVYEGYRDLIHDFRKEGDSLVVIGIKHKEN